MGCDLVKEIGTKLGTDPEVIRLLRHLIASHHGKIEYGAAALPAIPEAFVLNEIDMIDSRMYQLEASMEKLEKGTMSKDRSFFLGNVKLYNPNI